MKPEIYHEDRLGRNVSVGDYVTFAHSNYMYVGRVTKLNPKMLKIDRIPSGRSYNIYSQHSVIVEGELVTHYVLKYS